MPFAPRIASLIEMLEKEPEDLFLNYALAMEYISLPDWAAAKQQLSKVIKINPTYIPAFYQLGKVHEATQHFDLAISYYKQGLTFAREQKNNKALNEFNEAIFMLED